MSPLERSMKMLRAMGYIGDKTERWISFGGKGGVRKDYCGFADAIFFRSGTPGCLAINTCTGDVAAHLAKYKAHEPTRKAIEEWINAWNQFEIHGWTKRANGRYKVRVVEWENT